MTKEISRARLVTALIELAGDELETTEDFIRLCKNTEAELIEQIIHTAYYYKNLNDD
jgi:hypothetical protein